VRARENIIPVFVPNYGCSNECVFCNQRRISGCKTQIQAKDVKNAIEKAAALTPTGTKRQLAFYGGSFTAIPVTEQNALLSAARPYLASGFISALRVSTRPDAVDAETLSRLSHYGVETIEIGAQSMSDEVLSLSGRGHAAADVENAARLVKAAGFRLILQMMTGLPGSSDELDIDTARKIAALAPDGVRIYPTVIVRDTALFDLWRGGRYAEHTVEDAIRVCAKIVPIFEAAGIPIIRLGLNPTDDLSGGDAVAGAYHPALGELVRSRILLGKAEELLEGVAPGSSVTIGVRHDQVSQMTGQHGCNRSALCKCFGLRSLSIKGMASEKDMIEILSVAKPIIM
jgi:histone acetyltransferase (RNA polymerase elongator complex component)